MDWYGYRFRSVWRLSASPQAVYAALEDIEGYPRWWPQVREVHRLDERTGTVRVRSLLPYDLTCTLSHGRRDPAAGVLGVVIAGDMDGTAGWAVTPGPLGTVAVYEQHVVVGRRLLRALAVPGRPFFRANHALMMRAGRRGLSRWLGEGADGGREAV